jgi:murein tripeptide amidase MpaA
MLSLLLLAGIGVSTNFEGGSVGKVETVSPTHLRVAVAGQSDQDGRNRQANWYYFRLDNLPHQEITIDLVNLAGEYDYHGPVFAVDKNTRPVYSYDDKTWNHFRDDQVSWDQQEPHLRLRFTPERDSMWIAHVPPYTTKNLAALLDSLRASAYMKTEIVGRTVDGREMLLLTITNPETPAANKNVIWLMFRQHAWETGSSWACEGAIRFLLSTDERAAAIRNETIFKIFPMADPDGVARGAVRFNRNGYDLNRNWDAVDARKMPEIAAQRKAVLDCLDAGHRLDLFLTLHNTESGEYLESPLMFQDLGQRLFQSLRETTTFNPTTPLRTFDTDTPPAKQGRMTVAQGLFHDRKVPAMTMEQMVEYNSKLARCPTVADRQEFGAALVRALAEARIVSKVTDYRSNLVLY